MRAILCSAALALAACDTPTAEPLPDGGSTDPLVDAGALPAIDAGQPLADAGLFDAGHTTVDAGPPPPPPAWQYIPLQGMRCGNGTTTGYALQLEPGATRLVFYLQGGGACWEAGGCYGLKAATHLEETVGEATVLAEAKAMPQLFSRDDADNPFRDASFVYVPYCTGDLHAGDRAMTYDWFGPKTLHHRGAANVQAVLNDLVPRSAGVNHVVLTGASAGGFGATLNWWRVQQAFGAVPVDVLNDSGPMLAPGDARFGTMKASWNLQTPPGCSDCAQGFERWLPFYAQAFPTRRFALLSTHGDGTIRLYFALDEGQFQSKLAALKAQAGTLQKTYFLEGTGHVVLTNPQAKTSQGLRVRDFIRGFLGQGPTAWDHAGP